jgi:hypothetical protein
VWGVDFVWCKNRKVQRIQDATRTQICPRMSTYFNFVFTVGDDILEPFLVRFDRIHGQGRHETVHTLQIVVLEREASNFGGANGGKVSRMRKQNGPLALFPLVKGRHFSVRRIRPKIGDDIPQSQN